MLRNGTYLDPEEHAFRGCWSPDSQKVPQAETDRDHQGQQPTNHQRKPCRHVCIDADDQGHDRPSQQGNEKPQQRSPVITRNNEREDNPEEGGEERSKAANPEITLRKNIRIEAGWIPFKLLVADRAIKRPRSVGAEVDPPATVWAIHLNSGTGHVQQ